MPELKVWDNNAIDNHNFSKRHYHWVNLTDSEYNEHCWLPVDGHNGSLTSNQVRPSDTKYILDGVTTIWAGLGAGIESVLGVILNGLVIVALLKSAKLRRDYLTPAIISLALTDFLFSFLSLGHFSIHFFMA